WPGPTPCRCRRGGPSAGSTPTSGAPSAGSGASAPAGSSPRGRAPASAPAGLARCHAPRPGGPSRGRGAGGVGAEPWRAGRGCRAEGGARHYGFYPSAGALRFVRFAGADVYSWKVLRQESSPHYRRGEWNTLKVRVEKGKFTCFVNGRRAFEVEDDAFTA